MGFAKLLGRAAMVPFSKALPPMGETERAALEAGTVGFEGRFFAGQPDFDALLKTGPTVLSFDEQAFLDNEKQHYLPRLADGRDLPCFGLTAPYAGSGMAGCATSWRGSAPMSAHPGKAACSISCRRWKYQSSWVTTSPRSTKLVRRTRSFDEAAQGAPNPELALAYLRAADRGIQVDDFAP